MYMCTINIFNSRWKYSSKKGSVSSYNVSQCINDCPKGYPFDNFSRHIFQTLERFIASGDADFTDEHIPTTIKRRVRRNEWNDLEQNMVSIYCTCVHVHCSIKTVCMCYNNYAVVVGSLHVCF